MIKVNQRRRAILAIAAMPAFFWTEKGKASCGGAADFARQAHRLRDAAVASGDQAYGAVIVLDGCVVGYGPSRVVQDANEAAHAERVALWDAQRRLGRKDLAGAVIYSTSRPCNICQPVLAAAGIVNMYVGPDANDFGAPAMG